MKHQSGNVFDELSRRGFIQQITDSAELQRDLTNKSVAFYIGFDPTADSLHIGHLMAIMAMTHMQRHGHRPIVVIGGGTAMVGDPSGKTEMRQLLTRRQIVENTEKFKRQLARYVDFSDDRALLIDNYSWLGDINYIEFLRDIGRHFSVNKMLTYETYKRRMETGLSFLEFNYQLLQAYDFLTLYREYNCTLQMGGDDQWANILAGADLIRRIESAPVYGMTFPLITTASGSKMGKTESGAVWLDETKTTPYEYFQYWVNVDDRDVFRFLCFFTLLPFEEIEPIKALNGAELNYAKSILAFEATALTHGFTAAQNSYFSALAAFGKRQIPNDLLPSSCIPRTTALLHNDAIPSGRMTRQQLASGPKLAELLVQFQLTGSRSESKRLISQGGVYINDERVNDIDYSLQLTDYNGEKIAIRLGKKKLFFIFIE